LCRHNARQIIYILYKYFFKEIYSKKIKDLIIDISQNGGENSNSCEYILEAITPIKISLGGAKVKVSEEWYNGVTEAYLKRNQNFGHGSKKNYINM